MIDTTVTIDQGVIFKNDICKHYGKIVNITPTQVQIRYAKDHMGVWHDKADRYLKELTNILEHLEYDQIKDSL